MATRAKSAVRAAEQRMEYQRCHAIQHRWESIPVTRAPAFGSAIDLRCENCGTVRRDIISRISGVLITRYYIYPDDYHDYERHDKAWWRAAFAESLYRAAKEYIDTTNEAARAPTSLDERRAAREAKKEWLASLAPLAKNGPPNPSPRITEAAQKVRRNQTTRKVTRQP